MTPVRLGAVGYLNARPLVYGLDRDPLFVLRFDLPSRCADLLHEGGIDIGMIPSIEVLRGSAPYRIVPGLGIISDGDVASVALYARTPIGRVRRIGLDTSSRTSAALTRILCREVWRIDPEFVSMPPAAASKAEGCDAALLIGDPALFLPHEAEGLQKIDLGAEWTRLTALPFVWAIWAGRPGAVESVHVGRLQQARDAGLDHVDEIARGYCGEDRASVCAEYLRHNIKYRLGDREASGLRRYYELAAAHGLVERSGPLDMF
ncbi:MAG: menaquinone biosynthetic enzyme MqnA/MqnD family protein [Vicinamibacterales bacterium]